MTPTGYRSRSGPSSYRVTCINCGKSRACLLIESHLPDIDGGYELHTSVQICRTCLQDPVAAMTLAATLAGGHAERHRHERATKARTRGRKPIQRL
jgi:hypothetical protein